MPSKAIKPILEKKEMQMLQYPLPTSSTNTGNTRVILRVGWNTHYARKLRERGYKLAATPFRAVMNAGDLLSRKHYACGGSSQSSSRPQLHGLVFGRTSTSGCDATGIEPTTCNAKFVYDSSDYIRYRRESAIQDTYTKSTNGGDSSNATQSVLRSVRRY